jgi:hypothetical protein
MISYRGGQKSLGLCSGRGLPFAYDYNYNFLRQVVEFLDVRILYVPFHFNLTLALYPAPSHLRNITTTALLPGPRPRPRSMGRIQRTLGLQTPSDTFTSPSSSLSHTTT